MSDHFTLYVDRLKDGQVEKISTEVPPDFLDIEEESLEFKENVQLSLEYYLADDHLVLHISARTYATEPCTICNEPCRSLVEVKNFYHTENLSSISYAKYDFTDILRETILLNLSPFVECNEGKCPERDSLNSFLKKEDSSKKTGIPTYYPFADLGEK